MQVQARVKITCNHAEAVRIITDDVLERYEGYSSPILRSNPRGYHAFLTLQVEVESRWRE